MRINGHEIGPIHKPWIVAEIAGEHCGELGRAMRLIRAAKDAGAHAVKLQYFDPVELARRRGGVNYVLPDGLWKGWRLGELYAKTRTPKAWFPPLMAYADALGITLFSSVFDEDGVEFLNDIGMPAFKIASREAADLGLVRKAAETSKPLIISTGTATDAELGKSVHDATRRTNQVALLYCVSKYPCPPADIDFDEISSLKKRYGLPIGFSDHTIGIGSAIEAVAAGACIIEKHFTLERRTGGLDKYYSLEPRELAELVKAVKAQC